MNPNSVADRLKAYCETYDLEWSHLPEVLSDLKVIPMIRGKSFEFTVVERLRLLLPAKDWQVTNPNINPQPGTEHGSDIIAESFGNRRARLRIECKLAGKGTFRLRAGIGTLSVKCMRSRTVSDNDSATRMAEYYHIDRAALLRHSDSYRATDFDYIISSVGNSMYSSNDDQYVFSGDSSQFRYLKSKFPQNFRREEDFKKDAFAFLIYARSEDLAVSEESGVSCKKRLCRNAGTDNTCGFIPDYPNVKLDDVASGTSAWKPLVRIAEDFSSRL